MCADILFRDIFIIKLSYLVNFTLIILVRMVFICILLKKKYTVYELMDYNYY